MYGKLTVALLLIASPALAAKPAEEIHVDESGQTYKIKKVCRTVEVAGSFIPRRSCTTKKIPVKPPVQAQQPAATSGSADEGSGNAQKKQ